MNAYNWIAQTFASGKTEKFVYQCIGDSGLPHCKNDVIDVSIFTFEKFQELYLKISPRQDIEDLYFKMEVADELELWKKGQLQNDEEDEKEDPLVRCPEDPCAEGACAAEKPVCDIPEECDGATSAQAELLDEQVAMANYHYTGATTHVHPYLSSFVNYAQPVKFFGFDVAEGVGLLHYIRLLISIFNTHLILTIFCYNKRQLSRIYPKGTRADSSNYMPQNANWWQGILGSGSGGVIAGGEKAGEVRETAP
ncbi:PLCB4 [Cordylochernes scorpioides]|uniref:phosphoinositide phospholipase C n=1 Tax=Cordylochernes scorpioides TaxID=51811 RepID=A0ABY6LVQ9_9ARAC|nr:PLCB4 [Cordylochernes scorpioides]